jgi:hypothetical protein
MFRRILIGGAVVLTLAMSNVIAQQEDRTPERPRERRGGGRRQWNRGGGFQRGGFGGGGAFGLLRMEEVHKELGVDEKQKKQIDDLQVETRDAL